MSNANETTWLVAVTETERTAIETAAAIGWMFANDSQYQLTDRDRAIRSEADAARKSAIDRHNAWDTLWRSANTDAERRAIEIAADVAERGLVRIQLRF